MKKSDKRRSGADVLLLLYYQATLKNLTLFEQMELNVYREIVLRYAMQFMKSEAQPKFHTKGLTSNLNQVSVIDHSQEIDKG